MHFTLGFSPCPNDTFIFDALVNRKIDTGKYSFETRLEDVQTLNRWAMQEELDVSKISYGVWPLVRDNYQLLDAGGALGMGVGPLLISKRTIAKEEVPGLTVAIPGEQTTAHMLFNLAFPRVGKKKFLVFSDIENAVLEGRADCGVIIHENRFTYMQRGLKKIVDLGSYWEEQTQSPIPLGGIVMKKSFDAKTAADVNRLIRESVQYAQERYPDLSGYVRSHAQEMDEAVMRQHIDLYVNHFSVSLGPDGKKAIDKLLKIYNDMRVPAQA